jgi:hypothetical protein
MAFQVSYLHLVAYLCQVSYLRQNGSIALEIVQLLSKSLRPSLKSPKAITWSKIALKIAPTKFPGLYPSKLPFASTFSSLPPLRFCSVAQVSCHHVKENRKSAIAIMSKNTPSSDAKIALVSVLNIIIGSSTGTIHCVMQHV